MESQQDLLFANCPANELPLPDPRSGFYADVAALWRIPVGEIVCVELNGHHFPELNGRLEVARAPEIPLNRRENLTLRIGGIEFTSRQISTWSLT